MTNLISNQDPYWWFIFVQPATTAAVGAATIVTALHVARSWLKTLRNQAADKVLFSASSLLSAVETLNLHLENKAIFDEIMKELRINRAGLAAALIQASRYFKNIDDPYCNDINGKIREVTISSQNRFSDQFNRDRLTSLQTDVQELELLAKHKIDMLLENLTPL